MLSFILCMLMIHYPFKHNYNEEILRGMQNRIITEIFEHDSHKPTPGAQVLIN